MSDSTPQITFGHAADVLSQYGLAYRHVVELGEVPFDFKELKRRFGGIYIATADMTQSARRRPLRPEVQT